MKNHIKKDNKGKPVNINISFNINSKSVNNNNANNNDLITHFQHIRSHLNSTQNKDYRDKQKDKEKDKLSVSFSRTPKHYHQLKNNKESTQFIKQNLRVHKSKRNSLDLTGFHNAQLFKKKNLATNSQRSSFKRKKSQNSQFKQNYKSHNNSFTRKKINNQVSSTSTQKISPLVLEKIFQDFQSGILSFSEMKEIFIELLGYSNSNQIIRTKKKSLNNQNKKDQINFTGAKISKNSLSNLESLDAKKIDKMRKRACKSQRQDINIKKQSNSIHQQTQSFMASARQSLLAHNIVNMKNINSSLMIQPENADLSPPSPRLQQSKMMKKKLTQQLIIKTSNSMIDIKQKLQKQRRLYVNSIDSDNKSQKFENINVFYENLMAKRIQRAWKKYKTQKIIKMLMMGINRDDSNQDLILETDQSSSTKNKINIRVSNSSYKNNNNKNKKQQNINKQKQLSINFGCQSQLSSQQQAIQLLQKKVLEDSKRNQQQTNKLRVLASKKLNQHTFKQYLSSCVEKQEVIQKHVYKQYQYDQQQQQEQQQDYDYDELQYEQYKNKIYNDLQDEQNLQQQQEEEDKNQQIILNKNRINNLQVDRQMQMESSTKFIQNSMQNKNQTNMQFKYEQQGKFQQILRVIQLSLQNKNVSKDQCLKRMLQMIHQIKEVQDNNNNININYDNNQIIKTPKTPKSPKREDKQNSEFNEIGSFTNKFQSKQMPPIFNNQFQVLNTSSDLDLAHDDYSLKTQNIESIQQALRNKETIILNKKQKQLNILNFKNESGRICEQVYIQQKNKIQKWYKVELAQLKRAKKNLLKGYKQARDMISKIKGNNQLKNQAENNEKSRGMIKCLSDKYILRNKNFNNNSNENKGLVINKDKKIQQSQKQPQQINSPTIQALSTSKLKRQKLPKQIQPENDYQYNLQYQQISKQFDQVSQHGRQTLGYAQFPGITQAKQIGLFDTLIDSPNKKLKYLCSQDKDDIYQFIFLDLCLEIYLQSHKGSKICKTLEKAIQNSKKISKLPKGIKTSLATVKQYLQKFGNFVLQSHRCTLKNLEYPMGPTAQQMLKYMHQIPQDEKQISSVNNQQSAPLVLSANIFEIFEKLPQNALRLEKMYDDIDRQHNRRILLNSVMHIHNKAIFDCVNENLDQQRPYGLWGKPFPWKKAIKTKTQFNQSLRQQKFKRGLQKTIENCSYLCGILVDKQQSLFQNVSVSQQYVNHIKQDRLSKMLANDLIQNQERWMFYDDQQTEVMIQLSNYVTKELMYQVLDDIIFLMKIKAQR